MLSSIRKYFADHLQSIPKEDESSSKEDLLHMVTSSLLIEMIRADHEVDEKEYKKVATLLHNTFDLDTEQVEELMTLAEQRADHSTSLYEFTGIINKQLDAQEKLRIIEMLWEVAYADGELDKYEDHLVRKVAELIYVPHSQFIQSKLKVESSLNKK